jgi:hypothetical protein
MVSGWSDASDKLPDSTRLRSKSSLLLGNEVMQPAAVNCESMPIWPNQFWSRIFSKLS